MLDTSSVLLAYKDHEGHARRSVILEKVTKINYINLYACMPVPVAQHSMFMIMMWMLHF